MNHSPIVGRTTPGIGPSTWQSSAYGDSPKSTASVVYRLYTETRDNLADIIARYFPGATLTHGSGIWTDDANGKLVFERSTVVEIVATRDDLQRIANLAGDIKHVNAQTCVLVTWSDVARLDV